MVASASDSVRTVGDLKALREVKRAEEEVREKRASAQEEARSTVQEAKAEARELVKERREVAQAKAEEIVAEAEAAAEKKAEEILSQAEGEAAELRDVPEESISQAVDSVMERFRSTVGGA